MQRCATYHTIKKQKPSFTHTPSRTECHMCHPTHNYPSKHKDTPKAHFLFFKFSFGSKNGNIEEKRERRGAHRGQMLAFDKTAVSFERWVVHRNLSTRELTLLKNAVVDAGNLAIKSSIPRSYSLQHQVLWGTPLMGEIGLF